MSKLYFEEWVPNEQFLKPLYKWLLSKDYNQFNNRIARIILSKLDWKKSLLQNDCCLLISKELQQEFALNIFTSVINQFNRKHIEANNANQKI